MTTTLEQLKTDVDTLRTRVDVTDSRTMETTRFLAGLKAQTTKEFEKLQAGYAKPLYELVKGGEAQFHQIDQHVGQVRAAVSTLKLDTAKLQFEVDRVGSTLSGLKLDVTGFGHRLDNLDRRMDRMDENINGLRKDVTGLKEDVAGLKGDVAGLKGDVAVLKGDVAGLKGDVAGLKGDVAVLKEDVADLKAHAVRADERMDRMDRNIGALIRHFNITETTEPPVS